MKKSMPPACARDARRFFEGRIQIAESRAEQHDLDRDGSAEMRPDDAPKRIDVERSMFRQPESLHSLIQQPVFRIEQQNPSHGLG